MGEALVPRTRPLGRAAVYLARLAGRHISGATTGAAVTLASVPAGRREREQGVTLGPLTSGPVTRI